MNESRSKAPTSPPEELETDLVLVGAGPVGLYGAYYSGFRGLRTVVVDSLPELGGQISAMYPEKFIRDVAGYPAVRGRDLVNALIEQAGQFSPTYLLDESATSLTYDSGQPVLGLASGRSIRCRAIVITGGIGKFSPRPLQIGQEFVGRGVEYFVPRVDPYADKDVVIIGGGDSALDWAATLHPIARSVTLVHRREQFRAHEHTVSEVQRSTVRILTSCEVVALHGNGTLEAVEVTHKPTGDIQRVTAQAVVAALGFVVNLGPLAEWGLDIRARRIEVSTTMATNLDGVYAAGDIVSYPGKVRLISVGFGEVALAVNNAAVAMDPSAALTPGHSTDAS